MPINGSGSRTSLYLANASEILGYDAGRAGCECQYTRLVVSLAEAYSSRPNASLAD